VPTLPELAKGGTWGKACRSVAAAAAWVFRAFFKTKILTASDVALAAALVAACTAVVLAMFIENSGYGTCYT
jgi:hypothetical protein